MPAGGIVTTPGVRIFQASVLEVCDFEDGERVVDVPLHGIVGVGPVGRDREGPVIHQAGDHVRRESDNHGLRREANKRGALH